MIVHLVAFGCDAVTMFNEVKNVVHLDIDVFCPSMKLLVLCKSNRALVILIEGPDVSIIIASRL